MLSNSLTGLCKTRMVVTKFVDFKLRHACPEHMNSTLEQWLMGKDSKAQDIQQRLAKGRQKVCRFSDWFNGLR